MKKYQYCMIMAAVIIAPLLLPAIAYAGAFMFFIFGLINANQDT